MRFAFILALVLAAAPASAIADDQPSTRDDAPRGTPDFLFGRPRGAGGIRGSWLFARADSDWYRFVSGPDQLTIEPSDFNAPGIAGTVGIAIASRVDAVFDAEFSQTNVSSEYRNFVDNNRQPITQTTRLSQVSLMGGAKIALTPRGRQISTYAWIPRAVVPYAGAGAGALFYQLRQQGDFIDVLTPQRTIFYDTFLSTEWTPAAHVCGGVDMRVARRMYATLDARYLWASGKMDRRQFIGFDNLDLAGLRMSAGVNFLF
jgi:hypothetical protein